MARTSSSSGFEHFGQKKWKNGEEEEEAPPPPPLYI